MFPIRSLWCQKSFLDEVMALQIQYFFFVDILSQGQEIGHFEQNKTKDSLTFHICILHIPGHLAFCIINMQYCI